MIFSTLFDALIAAHVSRRPWQAVAAFAALVFGVASLTALVAAGVAVTSNAGSAVARLTPDVNLQITGDAAFPDRYVRLARRIEGVSDARPVIERPVVMETPAGDRVRARFVGTDLLAPAFVSDDARAHLLAGPYAPRGTAASPADLAIRPAVVVDERFRDRAAVHVRDGLIMRLGAERHRVRVLDIVRDDEAGSGGARVYADIGNAQTWFGMAGRIDRIDCIVDPARLAAVRAFLATILPVSLHVTDPLARTERIVASTRGMNFALQTIGLFAALLAALAAYHLFGAAVVQRRDDLATLRSLGVTRGAALRALLFEALLYGTFGSLTGVLCGVLFASAGVSRAVAVATPAVDVPPLFADAGTAFLLLGAGIGATLLAAAIPAVRGLARGALAQRADPFERASSRTGAIVAGAAAILAAGATAIATLTNSEGVLAGAFAAVALAAAFAVEPLSARVLAGCATRSLRADVRIAAQLARAHRGRMLFAALPIVAGVSALCVAVVLVASDEATFGAATRAVFGSDAPAVAHAFDLSSAFLRGGVVLLILVGAVAVGSIWFCALLERRAAYGVLRLLGMRPAQIVASIALEAGVVAALSSALGAVAGTADLALIAVSRLPVVAAEPVWRIPAAGGIVPIVMFAVACVAVVPAALLCVRGGVRGRGRA